MATPQAPVVLRRYVALSFEEALDSYERDLVRMAETGWFPVTQTWGWDSVGSAGFLFGGSSWKPGPGTLAVTYRFDASGSPARPREDAP